MQDFRDSEKKNRKKWPTGSHFEFFGVNFVMGYPCVSHNILFYIHIYIHTGYGVRSTVCARSLKLSNVAPGS